MYKWLQRVVEACSRRDSCPAAARPLMSRACRALRRGLLQPSAAPLRQVRCPGSPVIAPQPATSMQLPLALAACGAARLCMTSSVPHRCSSSCPERPSNFCRCRGICTAARGPRRTGHRRRAPACWRSWCAPAVLRCAAGLGVLGCLCHHAQALKSAAEQRPCLLQHVRCTGCASPPPTRTCSLDAAV